MSNHPSHPAAASGPAGWPSGVRIAGVGSHVPDRVLSNADLEQMMDTSDEWIVQRTGIRERRIVDREKGETVTTLAVQAVRRALDDAGLTSKDLDLLVLATVGSEMSCPASACRVLHEIGGGNGGAMDIVAACSGWVYSLNMASELIRGGRYKTIAVIGAEVLSDVVRYDTSGRATAILFGDAAGAVILRDTPDVSKGVLAQTMHSDGGGWKELYIPRAERDFPEGEYKSPDQFGLMFMNGRTVFKFAVSTFPAVIQQTLDKVGMDADDVDMYICHQSNIRILEAARQRFGLPKEKLYVNIDRYGNTSAASVPLCLDELVKAGRVHEGQKVMFVAFGGGLTWATSLWQL